MKFFACLALLCMTLAPAARAADEYKADAVHSSAVFRIKHANAAYFWGRFNNPGGSFILDESDPARSSFNVEIQVANVQTGNERRDGHLKSPDFFNARQYPTITFKSTSVSKGEGDILQVTGNLTMHGVTKPITFPVEFTGKGEFPPGTQRAGVEATLMVRMSDFEIKGMPGALSDDVKVIVSLEGVKQ